MTLTDDFYLTRPEVALGIVRRSCPNCRYPIVIRFPPPVDNAPESAALRFSLHTLTKQERELFDVVYNHFPLAVPNTVVSSELYDMTYNTLRQAVFRLRPKLTRAGWHLIHYRNCLRLIEPTSVVEAKE